MKAVDTDDNDMILCIAHWHYYPAGYVPSSLQYAGLKDMNDDSSYPKGMNISLYKALQGSMINERNNWTGNGPQWSEFMADVSQYWLISTSSHQHQDPRTS